MSEYKQNQPPDERRATCSSKRCPRCLEKLAVGNARRTRGLTRATAEASVDVRMNAVIVRRDGPFKERSHEKNATARTLVLVFQRLIGGARLKTKTAVNALIDSGKCCFERRTGKRARRHWIRWRGILLGNTGTSAHSSGPRIPGFNRLSGSNALFTR